MGIVFAASADIRDLSVFSAVNGAVISSFKAATGTYSYYFDDNNNYVEKQVASRADYYIKARVYYSNTNYFAFRFMEGTTIHIDVSVDPITGTINAYRNATLLGSSASTLFSAGQWNCVEIYGKVHDTTGQVTVKLNGVQVLNLTAQDTRNAGTGVINLVHVESEGGINNACYLDDFVIRDDAWPGQGGLYLLTADGDGSDTGWTASTGQRWECVDEVPPSATDYISTDTGTPNTKNTFTFSNLGITPSSIASVSVLTKAKLSAAGTGNIRAIVKSGTTYGNGASTALDVTERWAVLHTTVNPDTSSAWDLTGVNAISAGVETL